MSNNNTKKEIFILYHIKTKQGGRNMDETRNCGCGCNCGCGNNNGCLSGLFGGCGDSEILFFIIIFLLLFTNCGCGGRGCC